MTMSAVLKLIGLVVVAALLAAGGMILVAAFVAILVGFGLYAFVAHCCGVPFRLTVTDPVTKQKEVYAEYRFFQRVR